MPDTSAVRTDCGSFRQAVSATSALRRSRRHATPHRDSPRWPPVCSSRPSSRPPPRPSAAPRRDGRGTTTYLVVLQEGVTGSAAAALVEAAGGTVVSDLSRKIGVLTATSAVPGLRRRPAGLDAGGGPPARTWRWRPRPCRAAGPSAPATRSRTQQWDMQQIRTEAGARRAGGLTAGRRRHPGQRDRRLAHRLPRGGGPAATSTARADATSSCPACISPLGTPAPCVDNQFHGTHVAGTVAARAERQGSSASRRT